MQQLAKFKQILYMGFWATLNFRKYERLKLNLRVFLAGHSVAMVTYCVTKIILTCSPVIGQFFWYHDCRISWERVVIMTHQNLTLGMCWKLFWATLSFSTWMEIFRVVNSSTRLTRLILQHNKGDQTQSDQTQITNSHGSKNVLKNTKRPK